MNLGLTHLRLVQLPRQELQCANKKQTQNYPLGVDTTDTVLDDAEDVNIENFTCASMVLINWIWKRDLESSRLVTSKRDTLPYFK